MATCEEMAEMICDSSPFAVQAGVEDALSVFPRLVVDQR